MYIAYSTYVCLYYCVVTCDSLYVVLFCTVQPLQIKSAIAVEGLKGYIYVEAFKQTHVKQVWKSLYH